MENLIMNESNTTSSSTFTSSHDNIPQLNSLELFNICEDDIFINRIENYKFYGLESIPNQSSLDNLCKTNSIIIATFYYNNNTINKKLEYSIVFNNNNIQENDSKYLIILSKRTILNYQHDFIIAYKYEKYLIPQLNEIKLETISVENIIGTCIDDDDKYKYHSCETIDDQLKLNEFCKTCNIGILKFKDKKLEYSIIYQQFDSKYLILLAKIPAIINVIFAYRYVRTNDKKDKNRKDLSLEKDLKKRKKFHNSLNSNENNENNSTSEKLKLLLLDLTYTRDKIEKYKYSKILKLFKYSKNTFTKINIYNNNYLENENVMKILMNNNEYKYLNRILNFTILDIFPSQIISLFDSSIDESFKIRNNKLFLTECEIVKTVEDLFSNYGNLKYFYESSLNSLLKIQIKLMISFLEGLKSLHELGIVHCDISLSNIGFKFDNNDPNIDMNSIYGILLDFNSSKLSSQPFQKYDIIDESFESIQKDDFHPKLTCGYAPKDYLLVLENKIPELAFTKYHDIHGMGIVFIQISTLIFSKFKNVNEFKQVYNNMLKDHLDSQLTDKIFIYHHYKEYPFQENNLEQFETKDTEIVHTLMEIISQMIKDPNELPFTDYYLPKLYSFLNNSSNISFEKTQH